MTTPTTERCPTGLSWFDTHDDAQDYINDLTRGAELIGIPVVAFRSFTCIHCNRIHVRSTS